MHKFGRKATMTMSMMKKPACKLGSKETMKMTMKMTMTKRPACKLGSY